MVSASPGHVDVSDLLLINFDGSDSVDLRKLVGEINLYEDLMKNTMYGNLVIYDAIDMVQDLPIIGEESLKLSFNIPGERETKISRIFRVYKLSSRKRDKNDTAASYILHFTSREYYDILNKNIQQAYTGLAVSEIAQKVYDSYIFDHDRPKTLEKPEETVGQHDVVLSNLNPFKAMNYLARRAESDKNPNSNYIFYEDHNGFHFKTVEGMIREGSKETFFYKQTGYGSRTGSNSIKDAFIIETMEQHQSFDVMKNLMNGMYSNKVLTHDMIRKVHTTHSFDYVSDYDDPLHSHLTRAEKEKGGSLPAKVNSKYVSEKANFTEKLAIDLMIPTQLNQPQNKYIKTKNVQIRPKKTELFGLRKQSAFSQLDTVVTSISIPGDHHRVPGEVITLKLPTATGVTDLKGPDKYYSGDYLITQVRHKINLDLYTTVLQVVKESFGVKEIKKGTGGRPHRNVNEVLNIKIDSSTVGIT